MRRKADATATVSAATLESTTDESATRDSSTTANAAALPSAHAAIKIDCPLCTMAVGLGTSCPS